MNTHKLAIAVCLIFLAGPMRSVQAQTDQKPSVSIIYEAIAKRMRVPIEVVRPAYEPHEKVLEEIPYVHRDSVQVILDQYPREQARTLTYGKLVDNSLLQQLEESGFIRNLYRK